MNSFAFEVLQTDDPRRALAELLARQATVVEHTQDRRWSGGQSCSRFVECHLAALGTFAFSVRCYPVTMPQSVNTTSSPAVATPRRLARTVQDGGERTFCHVACENDYALVPIDSCC